MENDIGINNPEIPKIQTDGDDYSKEPGPDIGIDGEPEMEIQIGAVFSLASIDDSKQNESMESASLGSQSSFTGSTVSAKEDDSLTGTQSDVTFEPHEENNDDNKLVIDSNADQSSDSTTDQNGGDISNVQSETPFCSVSPTHKVDASGEVDCGGTVGKREEAQVTQKVKHVLRQKITKGYPSYVDIRKYSYCYVKLSDVLTHNVIKKEVMKMNVKNESNEVEEDSQMTTQELKKQQKPRSRKKKPVRITMKKWKKKKSVIEQNHQTEVVVVDDPQKPDTITENLQNRPCRKRKFNHNLFTDTVVLDSRGICNYADYEIKAMEEEESRRGQTTIYGFRGSRPQVARTKKKLCRVKREDMPFISVKLDKEQIDKLDKSKYSVSKSVGVIKSIKCYMNHQLQKINNGSFRISKSWSKDKRSRHAKKYIKERSKTTNSSKVPTGVMKEDGSISTKKKMKENTSVMGFSGTSIPQHQQQNSLVLPVSLPVKVEQSSVSSYDENKGTLASNEARVSLNGRYRKPSKKYNSFITDFERYGSSAKIPTKTEVKLEQPSIEMDIAGDAEDTVRNGAVGNSVKSNNSPDVKGRINKHEPNPSTLSVQNDGCSATSTTANVKTEISNKTKLPNIFKPMTNSPTFVMKSQSVSNASPTFPPNLLKSTVNELARVQNTKKFFQLRVGDKMVLIPADGGDIVPKAYVIDVANHPLITKTPAEQNPRTPDMTSKKTSTVSSKHVKAETTRSEKDKKDDSLGRVPVPAGSLDTVFSQSANEQVTSVKSTSGCSGGKMTINTGNVLQQALQSPLSISPHLESQSSLIFNSKQHPPVLSPKGLADPEGVHDDTTPPVLQPEYGSCDNDNQNLGQMKSILPKVLKDPTSGGESARMGGAPPALIVIPNEKGTGTVVIKKEPEHIKNFEIGAITKATSQRKESNTLSTFLDSQETRSSSNVNVHSPYLPLSNVTVSENCSSSSDAGRSDNTLKVEQNKSVTSQSAQEDKNKTKTTAGTLFVASVGNEANPEEASGHQKPTDKDRERSIFGIETVTHVPANETLVQERIRKLRERLKETQADLDNVRKTFRIKKEYDEDDS